MHIYTGSMLLAVAVIALGQESEVPRITGATKVKPYTLVRLRAEGVDAKAALLWRIHPAKDAHRATTPRGVLEFTGKPGLYEIELLVIRTTAEGLNVEETRVTVEIEGGGGGKTDAEAALGRLRFGAAGCTATVIGPRRGDGRWEMLTAAHCTGAVGTSGTFTLSDGRTFNVTVVARNSTADLAWLKTDAPVEEMPHALLATRNPAIGTEVWHQGFGVDRPGNREVGRVTGVESSQGQLAMELSVSSGDSGGSIFRTDTGEVVAVVCCTTERGRKVLMFGGSCEQAARLRPTAKTDSGDWRPLTIPLRKGR